MKYLPQMANESSRRYLFVAIDRATRWVFSRINESKTAANARRLLRGLERASPMHIRTMLTDHGKEFTDRLFGRYLSWRQDSKRSVTPCWSPSTKAAARSARWRTSQPAIRETPSGSFISSSALGALSGNTIGLPL